MAKFLMCLLAFLHLSSSVTSSLQLEFPYVYKIEDGPKLYKEFVQEYGRKLKSNLERAMRYDKFIKTLEEINIINVQPGVQKVRLNKYADYFDEEKQKIHDDERTTTKIDPELLLMVKLEPQIKVESLFKFMLRENRNEPAFTNRMSSFQVPQIY